MRKPTKYQRTLQEILDSDDELPGRFYINKQFILNVNTLCSNNTLCTLTIIIRTYKLLVLTLQYSSVFRSRFGYLKMHF